ncbi:PREDICTED: RAD52 motif-containing protein 1-like [Chrysochloris asiatica]|uniref:RAD52 motif-containing protein 1 n=1 Tax=Chrysochloris asiatica TaxID=185453 RepID=A0A9B0SY02_CHRAS|nr:PREDICTED: RAD52 motif-containing protein 1-like [Chrysochloris asiatica]
MVELVPFVVPTDSNKTLVVWELNSGPTAEDLHHFLFTVFSQFGLLYSVRVFPNAAVARPGFYAIIKFYSARDAHRAQKACDRKQLFQESPVKVHLGTKHKAVQHQALALNSSRCQELANYYFGFNGWSKRIIKLQDLSDLDERENEDIMAAAQKQNLKFFCALEVVLPAYECRSPGIGIAEGPVEKQEEESGKIAVEYTPSEEIIDSRTEEELQEFIHVSYFSWKQYGQEEEGLELSLEVEEFWLPETAQHFRRRLIGLDRCAQEPPCVMSVWSPWLLLALQPLWLLLLAAPFPESDLDLTEPWSSPSLDHLRNRPTSLYPCLIQRALTMDSPVPAQMLAPPQELTETLDMDSATEPPPMPDQFSGTHQDLNDHLPPHQKLPEVGPVLDWDQNQALALPPQLKSKIETPGQQEASAQPLKPPQQAEPSPGQQEAPAHPLKPSVEVGPSPVEQESSPQPPETPEELEP